MTYIFENFEIHRKFPEIGRFEYENVPENPKSADCVAFPYIPFTNVKGNQANQLILDTQEKFQTQIDLSRRIFDGFQKIQKCSSFFFGG